MKTTIALLSLFLLPQLSGTVLPKNGEQLIEEMYQRYQNDWYQTLTFEQKTTFFNPSGEVSRVQTWYEAMALPDKLTIKFGDWTSGNGMIFRSDSLYQVAGGVVQGSQKFSHPLLVLGFSVYAQAPSKTIATLKALDIDLTKIREAQWQGKAVYVIGADKGDTTSNQFWIEKDRLLFVRLIQRDFSGNLQDTRFNKYEKLGEGWIAPEVIFYTNGKITMKEEYSDMVTPPLKPEIFDPKNLKESKW